MTSNRIDNTDEIGLAILQLVVQRQLGWIIREVRKKDVGIDANIEQVVEGNPTAKYISIQLKTVKGKVDFPQIGFEKGTTERGFSKVSKSV